MTEIVIGPGFAREIEMAGLMGLPFAWDAGGVTYGDALTGAQRAAIEAVVAAHDPASGPDLAAVKAALKGEIDAAAEVERLKYITPGAGQALTYAEKAAQARACLAAPEGVAGEYPLIEAEIGITGADVTEVATVVIAAYQAWLAIGAQIEAARLGGKAAVDAAGTVTAAQAARDGITWP